MSRSRVQLTGADLVDALRYHSAGTDAQFAAVNLLIDHGVFLNRAEFRDEFVRVTRTWVGCAWPYTARIRWGAAVRALDQNRIACSGSEADILRIAASLGAPNVPVCLFRVLGALDNTNIGRVIDAILLANCSRPYPWPWPTEGRS
jgi:hypothetical protein